MAAEADLHTEAADRMAVAATAAIAKTKFRRFAEIESRRGAETMSLFQGGTHFNFASPSFLSPGVLSAETHIFTEELQ
jgi:hypothetical protein